MRTLVSILILSFILAFGFSLLSMLGYIPGGERRAARSTSHVEVVAPPLQDAIDEYAEYISESLCESGTPGAAIAIVQGDKVVYLQGFGVRDLRTRQPVDEHTVFRLGSVSKCFASALTGALVEEGNLEWEDAVVEHWSDFSLTPREQTGNMKIQNLLSHTTGFPYHAYTNLIEEGQSLLSLVEKLENLSLVSPIGTRYDYQNVAFSIIAKVVESSTGKSFDEVMEERIVGPLEMDDMSMSYDALYGNPNAAQPHVRRRGKWNRVKPLRTYYNVAPAGGMNASIADMAKWLQAMLGHAEDIISPRTIDRVFEPFVPAAPKNKNFNRWKKIKKSYYGMGWRILCFESDTIFYHGGYVRGYRSEVVIRPKEKIGICLLANGAGYFANRALPAFLRIYDKHHPPSRPVEGPSPIRIAQRMLLMESDMPYKKGGRQ